MNLTRRAFLNGAGYMLAAASMHSASAQQHQHPRFRIVALPLLRGCEHSYVTSINNKGQAVGMCSATPLAVPYTTPATRAVLWEHGKVIDILKGQFPSPQPLCINNGGQILLSGPYCGGDRSKPTPEYRALWDGKLQQTWHTSDGFLPDAMNNLGEMAGRMTGGSWVGFLGRDGKVVPINVPGHGFLRPTACCINDAGQVTGTFCNDVSLITSSLFMWQDGKLGTVNADSSLLAGARVSYSPGAINEKGQVVGTFDACLEVIGEWAAHLFIWESAGIIDRGVLGYQGMAGGINNTGMIVGEGDWPFLMSGGEMLNLNSLLPRESGWTVQRAAGINDRGQIVGNGQLHRKDRAFLLTPVA